MSDAGSDFDFDDGESFTQEETKSRFTNYSMTSSVIRRNEGLTFVDDRFEKVCVLCWTFRWMFLELARCQIC